MTNVFPNGHGRANLPREAVVERLYEVRINPRTNMLHTVCVSHAKPLPPALETEEETDHSAVDCLVMAALIASSMASGFLAINRKQRKKHDMAASTAASKYRKELIFHKQEREGCSKQSFATQIRLI